MHCPLGQPYPLRQIGGKAFALIMGSIRWGFLHGDTGRELLDAVSGQALSKSSDLPAQGAVAGLDISKSRGFRGS
jgi:hypothetical protein